MSDIRIRDRRKAEWFWTHKIVLDEFGPKIGAYGYAVYTVLCRYADNDSQACFPSMQRIADLLGISVPTVRRALAVLSEYKLVQVIKGTGKEVSQYVLLDPQTNVLTETTGTPQSNMTETTDTPGVPDVSCGGVPDVSANKNHLEEEQESLNKNHSSQSATEGESGELFGCNSTQKVARSRKKSTKPVDARFTPFVEAVSLYWKEAFPEVPFIFDASEGMVLKSLLKSCPELTLDTFKKWLANRLHSEAIPAVRPRGWLANISKFATSPLDRFGNPKKEMKQRADDREWMTPERLKTLRGF